MMHLGAKNTHTRLVVLIEHSLRGAPLEESVMKKDLGVLVDLRPNNSMKCEVAANIASSILSCTKKGIQYIQGINQ